VIKRNEAAGEKSAGDIPSPANARDFRQQQARRSEHSTATTDSGKYRQVTCFDLEKPIIQRLYAMKPGAISEPIKVTTPFSSQAGKSD
jgi:hypothetical protein